MENEKGKNNINLSDIIDKNMVSKYIKEKSYRKAKEIYGENLPQNIEKRLKLELDSITKNNFEQKYLITSYVAQKSKEMGYLSYTRGSVGNSFVAFLLEITDFNPIEYHLPFEMFAGIKYDKEPDIELYISEDIIDKIREEIKDVKEEIKIHETNLPTFLKKLQDETKINPQDIDFDDKDTLNLFAKADTKGIYDFTSDFMLNMLKQAKIRNFNDLVCVSALSHGSGTWNQNLEYLIKDLDIPIDMLVSSRADVMNYLMEKNIDKEKAYEITEFIKKGRAYMANDIFSYSILQKESQKKWEEYKEILEGHHIPQYYIDSFERIKYLFPKAHSISVAENSFRIAWYKAHYPEAFYKIYFETNKTININCYYTQKDVKRKLKRLYDEKLGISKNGYKEEKKLKDQICEFEVLLEMFNRGIKKDVKREEDIYDLINSKAIGDYCREIGYKFNIEELAVLIYRNNKMSIEEKISKYQDLIDNYPDMEVLERLNCKHYDSVKTMIKNEIDRITELYQDFIGEDDCIYGWSDWNRNGYSNDEIYNAKRTYREIKSEITNLINEYNDIDYFSITKKYFDGLDVIFRCQEKKIVANCKVIKKIPKIIEIMEIGEEMSDLEGIFINIPVPFKKGDILISDNATPYKNLMNDEKKCIFVLNSLTIWNERIKEKDFIRELDMSDMMGNGYYLVDGGKNFVLDDISDYDSFEYFEGELEESNRILKLISSFLKGKIDNLELFVKAYESFKSDYERKKLDSFVDEDLKLLGFSDFEVSRIHHEQDKIYNMPENKRIDYIINNTYGLKGIEEENVKQIETDFYDNVFVLTIDSKLYKNGELVDKKIKEIHMLDGCHLYKVTNDNKIRPIDDDWTWDDMDTYLNNNDCSYKKILFSTMNIVALTNNGEIREIHQYPSCIIPENYVGVEDIKIEEVNGLDIPYIYKNNHYIKLYEN